MSLQPLPPQIQDILNRAMRTQYVVLPAQVQTTDNDDDQEIEIIQQLLTPRIYFEDLLSQQIKTDLPNQTTNQQITEQTQTTDQTEQTKPKTEQPQTNKITKAQALSLRLILGFVAALLLVLGLLTSISSDYLDQIVSSIKEVFGKDKEA
jgi:hypothetical protein